MPINDKNEESVLSWEQTIAEDRIAKNSTSTNPNYLAYLLHFRAACIANAGRAPLPQEELYDYHAQNYS